MDYDALLKKLGTFGPYQKRLFCIVFFPVIFNSFGTPVTNFLLGEQKYRCQIPSLLNDSYAIQSQEHKELINATIPILPDGSYDECKLIVNGTLTTCSEWVYDQSVFTKTVDSQFDLVCDNSYLHSLSIFIYFFGAIFATVTLCPLADVIGRRNMVVFATTLQFVVNIAMPFSYNVYMFIVIRFLDGMCGLSYYHGAFIIGMEMVGPSKRLFSGTLILEVYVFGEFLLVFFAYFIRDWKWLQLALAIPMVSTICYWWPQVLPESPRWLLSRGKNKEAVKILQKAATTNKVHFEDLPRDFRLEKDDRGMREIMRELFHSKKLLLRWIIIFLNWFVIAFIYYGLTLHIGKLGGNLYVNFTVSCVMEFAGYFLCIFMDRTGRKPMHLTVMFLSGISCLVSVLPLMFGNDSHNWIMIALSMVGKFGISAAFGEIFIYTGELFPTVVRSVVMGICSFGARVGSSISPYMYKIADGKMHSVTPLLLYGIVTIIVALLSIFLPETKKRKLLEQVEDADHEESLETESDSESFKGSIDQDDRGSETMQLTQIEFKQSREGHL
uniref:Organic cation transporter protein-like n=1 Tax=Crassostrea virginica TaxID=6565 RepID=A0A8B8DZ35_CRAVI|nr:organic cation transporter protein-like [Crassostrea virginica]